MKQVQKSRTPGEGRREGGARQTDIPPHAVRFTSHGADGAPHFDQRRLAASRRTPKPSIPLNADCTLTQIVFHRKFVTDGKISDKIRGSVLKPARVALNLYVPAVKQVHAESLKAVEVSAKVEPPLKLKS